MTISEAISTKAFTYAESLLSNKNIKGLIYEQFEFRQKQ
jgi:hypothetical protein